MKQTLYYLLGFLLLVSSCKDKTIKPTEDCSINYVDSSAAHPKAAQFQGLLDKYTSKGLPGIVLLAKDENGVWIGSSGVADIDKHIAMQKCHVGKVASINKIYMAVLTMKLVEQGVFTLDDKISKWIPSSILDKIEDADKFTIGDLLQHRTGVYDLITDNGFYLAVLNNPPKKWKQEELLHYVYNKDPMFAYGTKTGYSNTNFCLLSLVIDNATGRPHAELLREQVLAPLGLTHSYYYYAEALPAHGVAQGYFDLYNNHKIANLSEYNTGSGNGYTGLYSDVHDLLTFSNALFVQQTLVAPSSLTQMLTFDPYVEYDRQLGYGVQKDLFGGADGEYGIGHRGRDLAYSADMFYFPNQDKTMILLVNYGTDADSYLQYVFNDCRMDVKQALLH
ncbi:MAG TPA: serine hydrolase [Cytophagaceae bacterium]|nr:serine hydrolase [Cytophagaceae bacterium]